MFDYRIVLDFLRYQCLKEIILRFVRQRVRESEDFHFGLAMQGDVDAAQEKIMGTLNSISMDLLFIKQELFRRNQQLLPIQVGLF